MDENKDKINMSIEGEKTAAQTERQAVRLALIDACYDILYKEDGVYLENFTELLDGAPLDLSFVAYDLGRRNIRGLDLNLALAQIKRHETTIKLAEYQEETPVDSDVAAAISKDGLSAVMALLPPSPSGNRRSADDILTKIRDEWKVTYGLSELAVRNAVESNMYFTPVKIAAGTVPQKGADGYLEFLFNREHRCSPEIAVDGSADYKNLNLFESVAADAPIVKRVPPKEGIDGYNVKGELLPAKPGSEAKFPPAKNVKMSEDGLTMFAAKSGRIDYVYGRIEISDVYNINGNVDMGVGNIKFAGDVHVMGNVIANLTIEAAGLIEVSGFVEGATLIAGRDIILKNGIQGMDKGKLIAGGNIVAKFMENCTAEAKGNIVSDYIVHCSVLAGGGVTMKGKWGKIIGGHVRAGREVSASIIGSPAYDHTIIEIGVAPDMRAKHVELDALRVQLKTQLQKIDGIVRFAPANDTPERQEMRRKLIGTRDHLEEKYNETVEELTAYSDIMSKSSGGRVNATKCAYPNVKIVIDSGIMTLKSTYDFVTFKNRDGEIVFPSCEVTP
jgi:hypothetical protein